jgi:transposase-like protein
MVRPRSDHGMACQNPKCKFYLESDRKDVRKQGLNAAGHQRFQCLYCGRYFVETANTPLYCRKIPESMLILVGKLLIEKTGNRAISRITGLTQVTVGRVLNDIALHAREFNEFMAGKAKVGQTELDEMWTFVKKNKRTLTPEQNQAISKAMLGST